MAISLEDFGYENSMRMLDNMLINDYAMLKIQYSKPANQSNQMVSFHMKRLMNEWRDEIIKLGYDIDESDRLIICKIVEEMPVK